MDRGPPGSMGFPRQEHWSGEPLPPPQHLPDPGTEFMSPVSPERQADSLRLSYQGNPFVKFSYCRSTKKDHSD